jgi:hypothetical protein
VYCPLCMPEYRDGFTECSDCRVSLISCREQAQSERTRLWRGSRQEEFDRILTALSDAEIPYHYKEIVNAVMRIYILGIPIGPKRPTFEYEIWVLRRDGEHAQQALAKVLTPAADD